MKYYFSKTTKYTFDEAIEKVKEELQKEGFGVVSEINMHEKIKAKVGVDFRKYRILGACNPQFAYKALLADDKIGTMLPCNVIVQQLSPTETEIIAVDAVASMQAVESEAVKGVAVEIAQKLEKVIGQL
jgi:uncharacterized protein (DUF302 family)